ncbi:ATP-binding protein [Butyrivibrio sp. X503]|uniref:ATP-binding protein n=1 Tax=Butyrivibrio sp. X503 TaxID=2364878 RepID=UPI000EA8F806|nr:ATP-binding protein [Butyrivibrio sp. X503]RKM54278.1 ATP-binding protein [Butyrivibrio sp. X503]
MQNPFSISFGTLPTQYISRLTQANQILDTFRADKPANHVYMLTGIRGSGKTVMMTDISEKLRKEKDWIVVEISPERDMLEGLAAALYAIPELYALFVKAKLDFSALGLGVSIENSAPITDIEVAVNRMLEHITKAGKKLLVTVDEVTNNPNVKVFSAAIQIYLRRGYNVFLIMTGLYDNLYDLQNEKTLTFLYRAPKIIMDPLNYTAIVSHYKKTFDIDNSKAEYMAKLTKGYSFAFQVLGYLMWESKNKDIDELLPQYDQYLDEYIYDKIWSEMSETDKKVVAYIATSGETNVGKIRKHLDMTTPQFSVYRDRLKRKGVISTAQYGYISLLLPRFDEYVRMHSDV